MRPGSGYRVSGIAGAALLAVGCATRANPAHPIPDTRSPIPGLREQAQLQQQWLQYRLDSILPGLMRRHGVQAWVVVCREYNEDPVFFSIVSATTFACRRRTIYVFHDRGPGLPIERLALGGTSQGGLFEAVRDTSVAVQTAAVAGRGGELIGAGQWQLLRRVLEERDPSTIAVNISDTHAFSDGISVADWEQLQAAVGPALRSRLRRVDALALDYIALRAPGMEPAWRRLQEVAWDVIARAFSREVITPGVTTTDDVAWWTRQRLADLGLTTWFHTSVDLQRQGVADPSSLGPSPVILEGDVLHIDFGVTAMRLNTDTQHMAYVLRRGERDAPAGLKAVLLNSNRLQDIVMAQLRPGRTGNDVLAASLAAMRGAGILGTVYTHPIGDHGHGAGPTIGLWDRQEGVPGKGDAPVLANMWFSIELEARTAVPEWGGQLVRSAQEEDAVVAADGTTHWALRRQTEFWLVR